MELSDQIAAMKRDPFYRCRTCAFWQPAFHSEQMLVGECRRNAPRVSEYPQWSTTTHDSWCGEWQARTAGHEWVSR